MQKEYNKWKAINNILRGLSPSFYDVFNRPPGVLEVWLLNTFIDHNIEFFEEGHSDFKYLEEQLKFLDKESHIPKYKEIINFMMLNYKIMPKKNLYEPRLENSIFYYGKFLRHIPQERINVLLKMGTLEEIIIMIMRYSFISVRGSQQWACPRKLYENLIKLYDIEIEGFASPLNSQMMMISKKKGNYCSLFFDTDKVFGSLGSFFEQDFQGKRVFINPPFHPRFILDVYNKIMSETGAFYIVVLPEWLNDEGYQKFLKAAKYTYTYDQKDHYYEHDGKIINATFKSTFFLIGTKTEKNLLNLLYS